VLAGKTGCFATGIGKNTRAIFTTQVIQLINACIYFEDIITVFSLPEAKNLKPKTQGE